MTTPEPQHDKCPPTCPKCGADESFPLGHYECGSKLPNSFGGYQTPTCRIAELTQTIASLRAASARLVEERDGLRKALEVANDAMCQATFIVKGRKSDLNDAIDKARKALGVK